MCELHYAFVNRISRTNAKYENRSYERPEEPLFSKPEWMLLGWWSLIKSQTEQKKNLIGRVSNRVKGFRHHAGRTRDHGSGKLQDRYDSVGKERPQNSQHTGDSFVYESDSSVGLSRKKVVLAMVRI
jgi:hypothetical protein